MVLLGRADLDVGGGGAGIELRWIPDQRVEVGLMKRTSTCLFVVCVTRFPNLDVFKMCCTGCSVPFREVAREQAHSGPLTIEEIR